MGLKSWTCNRGAWSTLCRPNRCCCAHLLPTAVGAVKSSGSGWTHLQRLVTLMLFLTVVLECQGALDMIVRKDRYHTHSLDYQHTSGACDVAEVLSCAAHVLSGDRVKESSNS